MILRTLLAPFAVAAVLISLLPASPARGQSGTLKGLVIDATSYQPLAGVNVVTLEAPLGASSGANGRFIIRGIQPGTYTVRATMIGYEDQETRVRIDDGETTQTTLYLESRWIEIPEIVVERVTLTGGLKGIESLPGSAHFISPMELERFDYGDVARVLRQVPGVNIQEEDGYGLRPNVGLRGTGSERSSKITVMEDGVLVAPAPYAAPAAYYFPTVARMQAVEVRKGSSQIKYGPYTTGGALNLVSTQIPTHLAGRLDLSGGEDRSRILRANIGNSSERFGFLLETYQTATDGFKNIDGGGNTGYEIQDYLGKMRFSTRSSARVYQALTLKVGYTDEISDETYLGLTDADYEASPNRRYAASRQDRMDAEHSQVVLRHVVRPRQSIDVTTTAYRTDFSRNWYKLDAVRSDANTPAVGISTILSSPIDHASEISILEGSTSPTDDALEVKANNRTYYTRGIQSTIGFTEPRGRVRHEIEIGVRVHEDEMDRFQWVDQYRMDDGVMSRTQEGTPGTESNRVEKARAAAAFLQYQLEIGRVTALPGLRFEHVSLRRQDYGRTDPERTGSNLSTRSNSVGAWIPGLGVDVDLTRGLHAFVGVHRGFAPPDSRDGTRPESSTNYELGGRLVRGLTHAEAVFFHTDYSNLLGSDLAASGGQGTTDQFNGGHVDVLGVEMSASFDLGVLSRRGFSLPVRAAYTFTSARFENSFESEFEPWGTVEEGDDVPYVPRHLFGASVGLETLRYSFDLSAQYTGRMRTNAGQGPYVGTESTDAHLTFDVSAGYRLSRRVELVARVLNVADVEYIAARRPAGIRPGLPRRVSIGLKTTL